MTRSAVAENTYSPKPYNHKGIAAISWAAIVMALLISFAPLIGRATACQESSRRDAMYWYNRAGTELARLSKQDWEQINQFLQSPATASPEALRILTNLRPAVDFVIRASRQRGANAITPVRGGFPSANHPLITMSTPLARILEADARARMLSGDTTGATQSTAALYGMGLHLAMEYDLDGSSAAVALFVQARQVMKSGIDGGLLQADDARTLIRTLDRFEANDPFHITSSLVMTNARLQEWIAQLYEAGHTDAIDQYLNVFDSHGAADIGTMTPTELREAIDRSSKLMSDVAETIIAADDPDLARQAVAQLIEAARQEGPLLVPWVSQISKRLSALYLGREWLAEDRELLRRIASGSVQPDGLQNAAQIYLRAAAATRALRDELFSNPEHPDDLVRRAELIGNLCSNHEWALQRNEIIDTLSIAVELQRCDFASAMGSMPEAHALQVVPAYLVAMHEMIAMLAADAICTARSPNDASMNVQIALGMIDHLARDGYLLSPFVALHGAKEVQYTLKTLRQSGTPISKDRLSDALLRWLPSDPFGFSRSKSKVSSILTNILGGSRQDVPLETTDNLSAILKDGSPDILLQILVLLDFRRRAVRENPDPEKFLALAQRLSQVVNCTALNDFILELNQSESSTKSSSRQFQLVRALRPSPTPLIDVRGAKASAPVLFHELLDQTR